MDAWLYVLSFSSISPGYVFATATILNFTGIILPIPQPIVVTVLRQPPHLDHYLDEFVFRFNRRKSASRVKLFYRLAQQAVQVEPVPFTKLTKTQPVVDRGVK